MAMVRMLLVPYDSGRRAARMGVGPLHLGAAGASDRLRAGGHRVAETVIEPSYDRDERIRDTALDLLSELGRLLPTP